MDILNFAGRSALSRCLLLPLLMIAVSPANAAANSGPVVRLFPTTVLEDIRETGQVAEEMENNLQEVIYRLDLQQQLYQESLCEGSEGDQGCCIGGGSGRKVLAITGAMVGASIANRARRHRHDSHSSHYTPQRCTTVVESREVEEIAGYRVRYLYQGQEFVKRVDSDPGDRIRVQVQVTPVAEEPSW